jgi:PST family polysaccharide transporter
MAGYFFGSKGLGEYSLGFNIAMLLAGIIISPIASIAYPTFCKLNDKNEIGMELVKMQSLAAAILFPVCLSLAAVASPIVFILYGDKWPELGMIIQILVVMPGMANIWSLNADAFRAADHPAVWTQISAIGLIFLLPALFVAGSFGFRTFVYARSLGALIIPMLCSFASIELLSIPFKVQFQGLKIPFLGSLMLFLFLLTFNLFLGPYQGLVGLIKIGICSIIGMFLYFVFLRVFDKQLYFQLFKITLLAFLPRKPL